MAYTGWKYKTPYKIIGAESSTVLDITLSLDAANINSDGSDLRAALADGTKIPVIINRITGTSPLTIRCYATFPTAPADNSYVYFYHGKSTPNDQSDASMVDRLTNSVMSANIFNTWSGGLNEFDLVYAQGNYVMFANEQPANITTVTVATTLAGLATASKVNVLTNKFMFPSAKFINNKWHIWAADYDNVNGTQYAIAHYISNTTDPQGEYTFSDYVSVAGEYHWTDHNMMIGPDGSLYCAAWFNDGWGWDGTTNRVHLLKNSSVDGTGTWTDFGDIFSVVGRADWHNKIGGYEHNCQLAVLNSKMYVIFDGLDLQTTTLPIRTGIAEINLSTGKAKYPATVISDGVSDSTIPGNPVFLDDGINEPRIYFTDYQNYPSAAGNLKYLPVSTVISNTRHPLDIVRLKFDTTVQDIGGGALSTVKWGTASSDAIGLTIASGNGGLYGLSCNSGSVGDFTIEFDFTPSVLAALTGYQLFLICSGPTFAYGTPYINILAYDNKLYYRISLVDQTQTAGTFILSAGNTYRVRISRSGSAVRGYINDTLDWTYTFSDALSNIGSWGICNQKNYYTPDTQTCYCTMSRVNMIGAYVPMISGNQEASQIITLIGSASSGLSLRLGLGL